jgi:hypothetical protein
MSDDEKNHQEELDQLRAERDRALDNLREAEAFYKARTEEKLKEYKDKIFARVVGFSIIGLLVFHREIWAGIGNFARYVGYI